MERSPPWHLSNHTVGVWTHVTCPVRITICSLCRNCCHLCCSCSSHVSCHLASRVLEAPYSAQWAQVGICSMKWIWQSKILIDIATKWWTGRLWKFDWADCRGGIPHVLFRKTRKLSQISDTGYKSIIENTSLTRLKGGGNSILEKFPFWLQKIRNSNVSCKIPNCLVVCVNACYEDTTNTTNTSTSFLINWGSGIPIDDGMGLVHSLDYCLRPLDANWCKQFSACITNIA